MIGYLLATMLIAFGMAVLLVEKADQWPVRPIYLRLKHLVRRLLGRRMGEVFDCTVCLSFWTALIADLCLFMAYGHFLWPLSGFATAGATWAFYETIHILEVKEHPLDFDLDQGDSDD